MSDDPGTALQRLEGAEALRKLADVVEEPAFDNMPHKPLAAIGAVLVAQAALLRAVSNCPEVCERLDLAELRCAIDTVTEWLAPVEYTGRR